MLYHLNYLIVRKIWVLSLSPRKIASYATEKQHACYKIHTTYSTVIPTPIWVNLENTAYKNKTWIIVILNANFIPNGQS